MPIRTKTSFSISIIHPCNLRQSANDNSCLSADYQCLLWQLLHQIPRPTCTLILMYVSETCSPCGHKSIRRVSYLKSAKSTGHFPTASCHGICSCLRTCQTLLPAVL
ncbi:unnamed protein product [Chondrus crispus]|uniref:Uncharacterized protein n=1 Tax=Chondrus crispus TaxID=2769 RepID=R7QJV0_CHOCR|nr:unnamed protein product [Chondrus crispus]CDF37993.1 unnamed protein product [Chondrus crispus]|eukprot:XP_005717862.1 unnamed protein product [Chondrus crispus]